MRGLFSTDYSHQPLSEIKNDLNKWIIALNEDINSSKIIIHELNDDEWKRISDFDQFKASANRCLFFLNTAKEDIGIVLKEIDKAIIEKHVVLLNNIGQKAAELDTEIGEAKHRGERDYIEDREMQLYGILRTMVHDLVDLTSLSERLKNFVGTKKPEINWNKWGVIISNLIALLALIVSIIALNKPNEGIIQNKYVNKEQKSTPIIKETNTKNQIKTKKDKQQNNKLLQ